ncbi:M4 family metallopeptidase [Actinosynnema sp. NPDC020468]|uniref:M4 family metallopeptidase n=1 Tax=Actinosynnema sp. NPDC020468 TaxID=3154488 RepID=UPI0033C78CA0
MKRPHRLLAVLGAFAAGTVVIGTAVAAPGTSTPTPVGVEAAQQLAAQAADNLVANRPAQLQATADDEFVRNGVVTSGGTQYVSYDRKHKGRAVVGGDFVVVTDQSGQVKYTSVAQDRALQNVPDQAVVSEKQAEATARGQLRDVTGSEGNRLVVVAGDKPALAWETTVNGTGPEGVSRLTVYVDATTGKVLSTKEHVTHGSGNSGYNGPVTINTTNSGGTYSLKDPSITNLNCQDYSTNAVFSGPDDNWGNGSTTNKETGCVDALFAAQTEKKMLSEWLGRNGMDGNGGAWPIKVGLDDLNAYYDGTKVAIGHNQSNQWISSMDVVGHEMGHGIDDHTPGGISNGNTQEFVADTFGAMTEFYANEGSAYDPPDYEVGEEINLVGKGPIRVMYDPSKAGHANCYSSSIPNAEVHAAAGPGNHWFYLLAEGTSPTNGQPKSPTCNNTSISGLGIQKAAKIMYNAMLMKTSSSSYLKYRTWTLQAAKNLYQGSCAEFNTVKAAWDAVSVPAQSGDPTCTGGGTTTTTPTSTTTTPPTTTTAPPGNCTGQILANPGLESGATGWTQTSGVISSATAQEPAHGGTKIAWLDGYGSAHTDSLSQSVTIPAGCKASLTFWLHVDTAETTATVAYDKLTAQAGTTTLATYSNTNKGTGYTQKTFDLSSFAGQSVTIKFTGVEDASLQTSFVLDDLGVTLS